MTETPGMPTMLNLEWEERIVPERFAGQTVIVTGAGAGIGLATTSRILREGGRVIAVDLNTDGLQELYREFSESLVLVTADLTDPDTIPGILSAADNRVDALVNNAGVMDNFAPLHEVTDETWQKVFAVNVDGMMRLTRAVIPVMLEAGHGSVVNLTSEAGLRGSAAGAAYTASKHAVVGLTLSSAFMYATQGIRFNAVAPGGVATGIKLPPNMSETGAVRLGEVRSNMPGLAQAAHLAASITFLASNDSVNINGAILPSDGGWSAV